MRIIRFLSILVVMMALASAKVVPTVAVPMRQASNLLQDPSFEQAASGDWKWQWWKVEKIVYLPLQRKVALLRRVEWFLMGHNGS